MLYSEEELQIYNKEKPIICLSNGLNFYCTDTEGIHLEDRLRYKLYRNIIENLHVYYKNKYFYNNPKGINSKYTPELNFISNKVRQLEKPFKYGEFTKKVIGDMINSDKKMLGFLLEK